MTADEAAELLKTFFPLALIVLAQRMAENEPRKKGKWKRQDEQTHLMHLDVHFKELCRFDRDGDDNAAGIGIRDMMYLQKREERRERGSKG